MRKIVQQILLVTTCNFIQKSTIDLLSKMSALHIF